LTSEIEYRVLANKNARIRNNR